jgi:hypothetical protein
MAPTESRTVCFYSDATTLSVVDKDGRRLLAGGKFKIEVGDVMHPAVTSVQLIGETIELEANTWAADLLK